MRRGGRTEIAQGLFDEAAGIAAGRMRGMLGQAGLVLTASLLRGNRVEADHIMGDFIARGAAADMRLLRTAFVHLKAYEARQARKQG